MRKLPVFALLMLASCFPKVGDDDSGECGDDADCTSGSDGDDPDGDDPDGDDGDGDDAGGGDDGGGDHGDGDGDDGGGDDGEDSTPCTVWEDADGDGYGSGEGVEIPDCDDLPDGTIDNDDDCDDADADISPNMPEICNGVDDDCNGDIDDADADLDLTTRATWYADSDADGFGDAASSIEACIQPSGTVADAADCDDGSAAINPAAAEVCNTIDDDCDGDIDDADSSVDASTGSTFYADADSDGHGDATAPTLACAQPAGTVTDATDCDDSNTAVNPAAAEVCNRIDDDCDGDIDDADSSVDTSTGGTFYADTDSDGYGDAAAATLACAQPSGTVADATDCNDAAASINPGAAEICNSVDDDCDGATDDADSSVDTSTGSTFYADADSDGFGDSAVTAEACAAPSGHVSDDTDCDDADGDINPGAAEVCNGLDDDCDTTVDSAAACPCNLERNAGHTYLFCETVSTWTAAESACEAYDNYQLAVVTDATEQAWIWSTSSSHDASRWWWLGLHNQSATAAEEPAGAFEWVDGSTVSYAPWYPHSPWVQPDDYRGVEDCVHIDPSHGYWNDLECGIDNWYGTELYYICESTAP